MPGFDKMHLLLAGKRIVFYSVGQFVFESVTSAIVLLQAEMSAQIVASKVEGFEGEAPVGQVHDLHTWPCFLLRRRGLRIRAETAGVAFPGDHKDQGRQGHLALDLFFHCHDINR